LKQKIYALHRIDKGESLQKITEDLGVGNSTIKDWRRNRKDIQSFSMTVEARVSLESRRILKNLKLDILDEEL
jgi:IS30 family transposase